MSEAIEVINGELKRVEEESAALGEHVAKLREVVNAAVQEMKDKALRLDQLNKLKAAFTAAVGALEAVESQKTDSQQEQSAQ